AGRPEMALDSYRELVAIEPGNADFRNNFGILLVRSGKVAEAVEQFEAALKADAAHRAARRNLELARERPAQGGPGMWRTLQRAAPRLDSELLRSPGFLPAEWKMT